MHPSVMKQHTIPTPFASAVKTLAERRIARASPVGEEEHSQDRPGGRTLLILGMVVLAGCWLAIEWPTIRHGVDFTDFGQAATIPHRMANGDKPFLDCWKHSVHLSEYYVSWLFRLKPDATLLDLRICSSVIQFIAFGAVFLVLSRMTRPVFALIATAVSMTAVKVWYTQPPSYMTVPATFAVLTVTVYWVALRRETAVARYGLSALAGLIGVFTATCRLPFAGIVVLPAAALIPALWARSRRRETLQTTGGFLVGAALAAGIVAAVIIGFGYGDIALARYRTFVTRPDYGAESFALFREAVQGLITTGIASGGYLALCLILASGLAERVPRWIRVVLALVLAAAYAEYFNAEMWHQIHLLGHGMLGLALGLIVHWPRRDQDAADRRIRIEHAFVCLAGGGIAFLSMAGSNRAQWAAIHASHFILALATILILELPARMRARSRAWFVDRLVSRVATGGLVVAVFLASSCWYLVYGAHRDLYSVRHPEAHVPFRSARLAGITSTPERVRLVDELVAYVQERVKPGGFTLAYYDLPLFYFATDTRPAPFVSWLLSYLPASLEREILDDMIRRGRIPELVIRTRVYPSRWWPDAASKERYGEAVYSTVDPERRPLNCWVEEHYVLDRGFGPLEVWRKKGE